MGIETARAARAELWRRYDAGGMSTTELDARLRLVDRAGDDPGALAAALDGPIRTSGSGSEADRHRPIVIATAVLAALVFLLGSVAWLVRGGDDADDGGTRTTGDTIGDGVPVPLPAPVPGVDTNVDCDEAEDAIAAMDAIDADDPAANPALLSDPATLPEGYDVSDEETIEVGTDPNIALSVYAGSPPPVEILARELSGPLTVSVRSFRYDSVDAAAEAARSVVRTGVCSYELEPFDVPDRPEINGAVVEGVIPMTAFAGFRIGDRRVVVAVPAPGDDDNAAEQARDLAAIVAMLELDAARTAPPLG